MSKFRNYLCLLAFAGCLAGCDRPGTEDRLKAATDLIAPEFGYRSEFYDVSYEIGGDATLKAKSKGGGSRVVWIQEPEKCRFVFVQQPDTTDASQASFDFNKLRKAEVYTTISGTRRLVYLTGEADGYTVHTRGSQDQSDKKAPVANLLPEEVPAFLERLAAFQEKMCGIKP
jgi:hypothetical protein